MEVMIPVFNQFSVRCMFVVILYVLVVVGSSADGRHCQMCHVYLHMTFLVDRMGCCVFFLFKPFLIFFHYPPKCGLFGKESSLAVGAHGREKSGIQEVPLPLLHPMMKMESILIFYGPCNRGKKHTKAMTTVRLSCSRYH